MPLCLVVSLESNWQEYAFCAGRDNPCCYQSKSVMCLHVGHSTKEVWSCISGTFTGALMVTAKNSEIAAEVWHKQKLHQVFPNPAMM